MRAKRHQALFASQRNIWVQRKSSLSNSCREHQRSHPLCSGAEAPFHIIGLNNAQKGERTLMRVSDQTRNSLPDEGLVRLNFILAPKGPLPISRSTWWKGVAEGRYPRPVKLAPRISAWPVEDIRKLIEQGVG
jgi:prophage regulatory protein